MNEFMKSCIAAFEKGPWASGYPENLSTVYCESMNLAVSSGSVTLNDLINETPNMWYHVIDALHLAYQVAG